MRGPSCSRYRRTLQADHRKERGWESDHHKVVAGGLRMTADDLRMAAAGDRHKAAVRMVAGGVAAAHKVAVHKAAGGAAVDRMAADRADRSQSYADCSHRNCIRRVLREAMTDQQVSYSGES